MFPQRVTSGPDDPRRAASEWLRANLPDRRIFLAGRVESWNLLWGGAFQPGGGLDPGDVQRTLGVFALRAYESTSAGYIEKWMRALAIDAVMLPAGDNFDEFGNLKGAAQFRETFRLLHEHSAGFAVYRIPRRQPGLARIVRVGELQPSPPLDLVNREADLDRFVAAVERGPDATAKVVFRNNNEFEVTGRLEKGEAYWIAMRHDDGWDAYCGDKQVNINVDAAGFMSIEAPPGEQRVRLYYRGTWPQRFGLLLTVLCGFGMFWAGVRNRLGAWS